MKSPFPEWAAFVMAPIDAAAAEPIHPEEAALIAERAVERRRASLRAGRALAHRALAALGAADADAPILRGPRGEPLWPAGWVGAISHSDRLAAAVVAPRARTAGLGVDLESLDRAVDPGIARIICDAEETRWVDGDDARLKTLFSAKESIFKALYPIAGVFLEFLDARVWPLDGERLVGELRIAASPAHPAGTRVEIGARLIDAHVMTWVVLPA